MAKPHEIPAGPDVPRIVDAVIESPRGSRVRYAYDASIGAFRYFAVLKEGQYPTAYGFIPSTMALDGEPLDVLVLNAEPAFPGCVVTCRPLGVLVLTDGTTPDHKILAVPVRGAQLEGAQDLEDVPQELRDTLADFFASHPRLSGFEQSVVGWEDAEAARDVIFRAWEGFL